MGQPIPLDSDLAGLASGGTRTEQLSAHNTQALRDVWRNQAAPSLTIQETGPSVVDAKLAIVQALIPVYMAPAAGGGDEQADAQALRKGFDAVWAVFRQEFEPQQQQQASL